MQKIKMQKMHQNAENVPFASKHQGLEFCSGILQHCAEGYYMWYTCNAHPFSSS
jgi:hypothetical protein